MLFYFNLIREHLSPVHWLAVVELVVAGEFLDQVLVTQGLLDDVDLRKLPKRMLVQLGRHLVPLHDLDGLLVCVGQSGD